MPDDGPVTRRSSSDLRPPILPRVPLRPDVPPLTFRRELPSPGVEAGGPISARGTTRRIPDSEDAERWT